MGSDIVETEHSPTTRLLPWASMVGDIVERAERILASCGMILSVWQRVKWVISCVYHKSREKSSIFVMILLDELINVQNLAFNKLLGS